MFKRKTILVMFGLALILAFTAQVALANFSNGPENPGPIVMRYDDVIGIFTSDLKAGISAIHGGDVVEFCTTGSTTFDLIHVQDISVPEDANRINQLWHANDIPTTVWPFTDFDCGLFTTVAPIATGTVDMRYTDNDVFVFLNPDNVNANAFGWTSHGKLYAPDGTRLNFNGVFRAVWDGSDPESLRAVEKLNLH